MYYINIPTVKLYVQKSKLQLQKYTEFTQRNTQTFIEKHIEVYREIT